MPVSLPPDVIDSILSYLCGTASIAECALVCHSWLPSARYHLLPPPKALHLDQFQIAGFLHLIDAPGSTFSLVSFSSLRLAQDRVQNDDWLNPPVGDEWRSQTAVQDLLARNLISFPSITSLSLEWIDWRTLSPPAVTSLHSNFKSVKELELKWIAFTLPELYSLISALTALEKIAVGDGVPFDLAPLTVDSVQVSHSNLCQLAFSDYLPFWMIQFFARGIRYTSGITTVSINIHHESEHFKACRELLETAGTNLIALKLRGAILSQGADSTFSKLLAFPHNFNLQEIDISPVNESSIMLLMQGLKLNPKPSLRQLKLGLEGTDDLEGWTGGPLVDETLSAMMLKDPKLTVELPTLHHWWHYESEQPETLETLEKAYLEKSLEKLEDMLPQTAEYWTLEVGIESKSMYLLRQPNPK